MITVTKANRKSIKLIARGCGGGGGGEGWRHWNLGCQIQCRELSNLYAKFILPRPSNYSKKARETVKNPKRVVHFDQNAETLRRGLNCNNSYSANSMLYPIQTLWE